MVREGDLFVGEAGFRRKLAFDWGRTAWQIVPRLKSSIGEGIEALEAQRREKGLDDVQMEPFMDLDNQKYEVQQSTVTMKLRERNRATRERKLPFPISETYSHKGRGVPLLAV